MPLNHTALLSMKKNKFCTLIFESPLTNKVIISDVCFAFSQWCFIFMLTYHGNPKKRHTINNAFLGKQAGKITCHNIWMSILNVIKQIIIVIVQYK